MIMGLSFYLNRHGSIGVAGMVRAGVLSECKVLLSVYVFLNSSNLFNVGTHVNPVSRI